MMSQHWANAFDQQLTYSQRGHAADRWRRMAEQFGLTPAARARLSVQSEKKQTAFEEMLA